MASASVKHVFLVGCFLVPIVIVAFASDPSIQDDFRFQHQSPSKGHKFVFAFMDNCLQDHEDVKRGPKLVITAPTDSAALVSVNVSMPHLEFFQTFSITAGSQKVVRLPDMAIAHGSQKHSNGIGVDASDDVFVYGIAEGTKHAKSDGFLALPVPEDLSTGSDYTAVSLEQKKSNTRRYSVVIIVGIAFETRVNITLSSNVLYEGVDYAAGMEIDLVLAAYEVVQIKSLGDLTGTKVHGTSPLGFLSGSDCGIMKIRHSLKSGCGHMVEQLPRQEVWGKHFIYRPMAGGPNSLQDRDQIEPAEAVLTRIKIVTAEDDTSVLIGISSGRVETGLEVDISGTETVHITAFKPVLVVAFTLYHGACEKGCRKRSPTMTTIPPLSPPGHEVAFTTVNTTDTRSPHPNHYISVMYDCSCFRRLTWRNFNEELITRVGFAAITDQICWNQFQVAPGQYLLSSGPNTHGNLCFISAYLFGHGINGGYGFPLGIDGEQRGQPAASRLPSSAVGSEFYFAFAGFFRGSRIGPRLVINRASPAEDAIAIQGSINSGTYTKTFTIPIGQRSIKIELPSGVVLDDQMEEGNSPVEVRAWGHVFVHGINDPFVDERSDAFLALPRPMMGMEYRLISPFVMARDSTAQPLAMFVIIGLQDNTFVSIKPNGRLTFKKEIYNTNEQFGFTINRRRTIFFLSPVDQTGTHIIASKPISVMSGATCGFTPFQQISNQENQTRCGHMLEHLPPVNHWGRHFVASTFRRYNGGDVIAYILASKRNTKIRLNGGGEIQIPEGRVLSMPLSDTTASGIVIEANEPVLMYQVPRSTNQNHPAGYSLPSLTLVPSLDKPARDVQVPHTGILLTSFNLNQMNRTNGYANLAARCSDVSNITMNGEALSFSDWSSPIGASDFCYMSKHLDKHVSNQLNTGGVKVSAVLYGFSPASGYSCPGSL